MIQKFKLLILLFLIFGIGLNKPCHAQKIKFDKQLVGSWISLQYDYFLKCQNQDSTLMDLMIYRVSPQHIVFDSTGRLTIYTIFEQKSDVGKPIKMDRYGEVWYKYGNLYSVYRVKEYLILSDNKTLGAGIVFRKYRD